MTNIQIQNLIYIYAKRYGIPNICYWNDEKGLYCALTAGDYILSGYIEDVLLTLEEEYLFSIIK